LVVLRQSVYRSPEDSLYLLDSDFRQTEQIPVPSIPLPVAMSWSSNGRHLLFSAGPEDAADIYRLELDSRTASALIISPGDDVEPDVLGSFQDN
jgi:Tol biopolymer transport system component